MKKSLPEGWAMYYYPDEIIWWGGGLYAADAPFVAKFPFVPGFFIVDVIDDEIATTHPIAGPFRSLHAAIATVALLS